MAGLKGVGCSFTGRAKEGYDSRVEKLSQRAWIGKPLVSVRDKSLV